MQFPCFLFVFITVFFHFTLSFPVSTRPWNVCRGDSRSPTELREAGGIQSKADKNGKKPNWILMMHVYPDDYPSPEAITHDPYVSTSTSSKVCESFLPGGNGWLYWISAGSEFIPVEDSLLQFYTLKEKEWSHRGTIPWRRIIAWHQYVDGHPVSAVNNPEYDQTTSKERGGQPDYAKALTAGHSAWSIKPWKNYAPKDSWSLTYDTPRMSDTDKVSPNHHSPSLSQTTPGSSTSSLQNMGQKQMVPDKTEDEQKKKIEKEKNKNKKNDTKRCKAFKGMLQAFMKLGC